MKVLEVDGQAPRDRREPLPLQAFPVLRRLGEHDLAALLPTSVPKRCCKGECIVAPGEETGSVVAIRQGALRLCLISTDGREMTLLHRRAGDLVGVPGDETAGTLPVAAIAEADGTILSLFPGDMFWKAVMAESAAAEELVSLVWGRLVTEEKILYNLFALTTSNRLAQCLVALSKESVDGIVRTRHDDLATLVGTTRQEVTRILGCFRERGWIAHEPHSHEIRVLDGEALFRGRAES